MAKEKLSLRFSRQQMLIFLAVVGAIVAGVMVYEYYLKNMAPVYMADFEGQPTAFRADLREAVKVKVMPDEDTLYRQIVKPNKVVNNGSISFRQPLRNVTIVFKSTIGNKTGPNTMGWYTVEASEIIKKLTTLYQVKYGISINFAVKEVQSYEGLRGGNLAPIIALVHPDIADGTYVDVDKDANVITISGGDSLRDFDDATVKFLMVAMGIDV
jgi:hypothetical protein